jgi:hypothetical protein
MKFVYRPVKPYWDLHTNNKAVLIESRGFSPGVGFTRKALWCRDAPAGAPDMPDSPGAKSGLRTFCTARVIGLRGPTQIRLALTTPAPPQMVRHSLVENKHSSP